MKRWLKEFTEDSKMSIGLVIAIIGLGITVNGNINSKIDQASDSLGKRVDKIQDDVVELKEGMAEVKQILFDRRDHAARAGHTKYSFAQQSVSRFPGASDPNFERRLQQDYFNHASDRDIALLGASGASLRPGPVNSRKDRD